MVSTMVGKGIPTIDAREKATGRAKFCVDLKLPGMLYGKIKRSPLPFARILRVDTGQAEKLTGVKAVITAAGVSQSSYGNFLKDELPLAQSLVRFVGDEIAAVAAVDEDVAEEALELIRVEYEELPAVFDPQEALRADAPAIHPELEKVKNNIAYSLAYERGDVARALQSADLVLEDRYRTQETHQAYLEPQACIAQFDAAGKLTYYASLQALFNARKLIAEALGMAEDRIRIIQTYVGGGFGGKASAIQPLYPISALLARKSGRPVRIVNTRKEEFIAGRPRVPEIIDLKMGFRKNGEIVASDARILCDGGGYAGMSPAVLVVSATRSASLYRIPNVRMDAKLVYTNKIPKGAFRGFGSPQMHFALESMMDDAAQRLGIDPMDLRLKNATQLGDTTIHGWIINSCGLSDSIRRAGEKAGWQAKRKSKSPDQGIGMGCLVHVSSKRGMHPLYDGSSAIVMMNEQGTVKLISGEGDIGQGAATIFAQIVSQEVGVPMEDIQIIPVDTDVSPTCLGAFASRVTAMGGNAVKLAAENLRSEILKEAGRLMEASPESLEIRDGEIGVKGSPGKGMPLKEVARRAVFKRAGGHLVGFGNYTVPDYVQNPDATQYGNISVAYPFGTQVAEVKIDRKTGKVEVVGFWAAHDLGKVMNLLTATGQVEGGVVQGIGFALTENYVYKNGKVLNSSFTDYRLLTARDIPPIDVMFIESNDPGGPYGAKGLAEPALIPTAASIGNAIFQALGIRLRELPFTSESVLKALQAAGKDAPKP